MQGCILKCIPRNGNILNLSFLFQKYNKNNEKKHLKNCRYIRVQLNIKIQNIVFKMFKSFENV